MHSLIIHLANSSKRAGNVAALLKVLPEPEVVDAVIGQDAIIRGDVALRDGNLHRPIYPFPLSPGEVGCFLSHRACWQRIVDQDLPYALIVEDD
ncbi:MAG: glycosyl transferase family 25, partial [Rhizobiales bacterium TMED143]